MGWPAVRGGMGLKEDSRENVQGDRRQVFIRASGLAGWEGGVEEKLKG